MSRPVVAIVTGAVCALSTVEWLSQLTSFPQNRGIGEAIAQILTQNHQDPLVLYATSRQGSNLTFKTDSKNQVIYSKLDISDRSSVENLASSVQEKHGAVDVLINNAGVNLDHEYSAKNVKITLDTNVRGTLQVSMDSLVVDFESGQNQRVVSAKVGQVIPWRCQRFLVLILIGKSYAIDLEIYSSKLFRLLALYKDWVLISTVQQMCQIFKPLLSKAGRIVNVSSTGSSLGQYSEEIQQRFRSSTMTLRDLEDLMQEYQVLHDLLDFHTQS